MAGLFDGLFGNGKLFQREEASASIFGTNAPSSVAATTLEADTGAVNMDAELSKAATKYNAKRGNIPGPGAIDDLIGVIKAVRNQHQVRQILEDAAAYIADGFRVKGAGGKNKEARQFVLDTEVEAKVGRMALELITVGWVVAYVSEMDKQGNPGITLLHNCTVTRGVDGKPHIFLKLTEDAKTAIKNNPKMYPKYWNDMMDDQNGIDITRVYKNGQWKQGGAYFVTLEPEGEDVYPISPLYPVLGESVDAERHTKVMGDLMDLVKWYWFQIRLGNADGQDMRDGRIKPIQKDRITQVGNAFQMGIRSGAIITPGDVNAEHHTPERSPWELPGKERAALKEVFQHQVGLPNFEEANNAAAAQLMAKSYLPRVEKLRSILMTRFVEPFCLDMGQRFPAVMEDSYGILSEGAIQDLGTMIQKHRQMQSTGGYSIQTLNELLDPNYDFDKEMVRKQYEEGFKETVGNLYEIGQGLGGVDPAATDPAAPTDPKGKSGDPKSASPKTQAKPGSQPGRPSK